MSPTAVHSGPVAPQPRLLVDHAVVPAGGLACPQCGQGACRFHGGHATECRDGLCAPHCPVRPREYGFYRTQWRRWPGSGVVPVSAEQAATPAAPPASQIPTVDEESPRAAAEEPELPPEMEDAAAAGASAGAARGGESRARGGGTGLPTDPLPDTGPANQPAARPVAPEPALDGRGDPAARPPAPAKEPPVPPEPRDKDAGLFDRAAAGAVEDDATLGIGPMRYPAPVGGSLAAGATPWRLRSERHPRARP